MKNKIGIQLACDQNDMKVKNNIKYYLQNLNEDYEDSIKKYKKLTSKRKRRGKFS